MRTVSGESRNKKTFLALMTGVIFKPHASLSGAEEISRAQLVMFFGLLVGLANLMGFISRFGRDRLMMGEVVLLILLVISFISYVFGRTRYYRMGAYLLPYSLSLCGYGLVLIGAANDATTALYSTVPMALILGSVILSVRGQVTLILFNTIAPIALTYLTAVPLVHGMGREAGIFFTLGSLLLGITIYRRTLEQSRLAQLHQANVALEAARSSLENRVKERTKSVEAARSEAELARHEAEAARQKIEEQVWIAAGQAQLSERMRGEQDLTELANHVLHQLCTYVGAQVGVLYLLDDGILNLTGSYAYLHRKNLSQQFRLGESLVGQAALERQLVLVKRVPSDYLEISTGLVQMSPRTILAAPFLRDKEVVGVIELASLDEFTPLMVQFIEKILENIAVAFATAQTRLRINTLLSQTQKQAQELRAREEDLQSINEELQAQTENLRASQNRLQAQQIALEEANADLEEKAATLQEQRAALDEQNRDLKAAQNELERKTDELTLSNRYKSEFLANMSHELRTPLNSLLILARMLASNEEGNLTADQVESASIIYGSGSDLLALINDILDLSKVEAGRLDLHLAPFLVGSLARNMRAQFEHIAQDKGLAFEIVIDESLPETIESDQQRVEQILKNLLSNAFKFTAQGTVLLRFERPETDARSRQVGLDPQNAIAISVRDTGIGIASDQQRVIFEAFRQADGSTSRKFGGTGLGLTISRQLAQHLGGDIFVQSEPGNGSAFTLYLPISRQKELLDEKASMVENLPAANPETAGQAALEQPAKPPPIAAALAVAEIKARAESASRREQAYHLSDDRDNLREGDKILLLIEDDQDFAWIVLQQARQKGFKVMVAPDGEAGLVLVKQALPDAILLDLRLPGISGWEVLEILKQDSDTRHIPVHILSAAEGSSDAYRMGAIGFVSKPITREGLENLFQKISEFLSTDEKNLLIVEDDPNLRRSVRQLLGGSDIRISETAQGSQALELLRSQRFDCMILDLNLPDMTGFELLNRINQDEAIVKCPVIVYTGKELTENENVELMHYADSVILKGVKSPERLLDEAALFLHRVVADLPEEKRSTIRRLHDRNAIFSGRQLLIVDDDMRSAFALSRLLGEKGLKVGIARSGQKALEMLDAAVSGGAGYDLVLMDIMMPGMDGYETMRAIRRQSRFRSLPIIAITAKAMKGDEEKCIVAGANDYLSKPIDADRLFSMLRVWLYH